MKKASVAVPLCGPHQSSGGFAYSTWTVGQRVLIALCALAGLASPAVAGPGRAEPLIQPFSKGAEQLPDRPRVPVANLVPRDVFVSRPKALAKEALLAEPGSPIKVGAAQTISELDSAEKTSQVLRWQATADGGHATAITLNTSEAKGSRIGLMIKAIPRQALISFYSPNSTRGVQVDGSTILGTIQLNLDSGDRSDAARTYWGPYIEGDKATVEIQLPSGVNVNEVQISIPKLSHFFVSPTVAMGSGGAKTGTGVGASASCNLDSVCSSATNPEVNSTAKMSYVGTDGDAYICSGTLLNDMASDFVPYFLSANHCISKQTVASTLTTYWFYWSTACNSGKLNSSYAVRTGGAKLLYQAAATDTSFMQLLDTPPALALFAGWDSNPQALGISVRGIHHPSGDLQKISFGSLSSYKDCSVLDPNSETFQCTAATQSTSEFLNVAYTSGTTEGGSSGSGLFKTVNGNQYLIGQLYGGNASCSNPSGTNYYGRFDIAYNAALSKWLDAGSKYIIAVTKSGNGAGKVTAPSAGIDCGTSCNSAQPKGSIVVLTAKPSAGSTFAGWSGVCTGPGEVCTVTLSGAANVNAAFVAPVIPVSVALDNSTLIFSNDLVTPWIGQSGVFNFGGAALQTGAIGDGQSTSLSVVIQGPGTLTFDWRVSSEKTFDVFDVSLDGVREFFWSGTSNWATSTLNIPSGTHTIKWTYKKDYGTSSGSDAGWLDHVVFAPTLVNNILQNPGFESGGLGWSEATLSTSPIIDTYANARTGTKRAWICGYVNCKDTLSQTVVIPVDAKTAYLDSWIYVAPSLVSVYDTLTTEIYDALTSIKLATVGLISNLGTTWTWTEYLIDLSNYIGKTIRVQFSGSTSAGSSTSFYLDDIKLMVSGGGGIENGWWWNPAEGGRGFAIEKVGDKIFMAGFLYDAGGRSTWFTASGPMSNGVFTAPMAMYSSGQTLSGPYASPASLPSPGNITLTFSDPTHASMVWPGGTVALQRFEIVPGSLTATKPAFVPERGWWWNPAEGGRGFALEVQGDNFFIAGFMYDTDGHPAWYVSTGKMENSQTFRGNWTKYSGGQTMTGPYKSPGSTATVESVAVLFTDSQNAKLYLQRGVVNLSRFTSF